MALEGRCQLHPVVESQIRLDHVGRLSAAFDAAEALSDSVEATFSWLAGDELFD